MAETIQKCELMKLCLLDRNILWFEISIKDSQACGEHVRGDVTLLQFSEPKTILADQF